MNLDSVNVVCFSPTGTTRKVLGAVLEGLDIPEVRISDLTDIKVRDGLEPVFHEDVVLFGVPVYAERIPPFLHECLNKVIGNGKPAVLVCVYGNIRAGIALNELASILRKRGFIVTAAGLFIGEHTFSCKELPIAKGRPDTRDIDKAHEFGSLIRKKLLGTSSTTDISIHLPRKRLSLAALMVPPRGERLVVKKPDPDTHICFKCGICFEKCPMGAIKPGLYFIDESRCIRCLSCVKKCPVAARRMDFKLKPLLFTFLKSNGMKRKQPVIYL